MKLSVVHRTINRGTEATQRGQAAPLQMRNLRDVWAEYVGLSVNGDGDKGGRVALDYADREAPAIDHSSSSNSCGAKRVAPGHRVEIVVNQFDGLTRNVFHLLLPRFVTSTPASVSRLSGGARTIFIQLTIYSSYTLGLWVKPLR
jgi:hypothetical protein